VVDATQGVQAQTLANVYLAMAAGLKIVPVINKIDLPAADIERVVAEIVSLLACRERDILLISAKTGEGVADVLEAVTKQIPPPVSSAEQITRGLIFDSYYDDYRGVILYVRVFDGEIAKGSHIKMMATGTEAITLEVGTLTPK